jgi:hypothetical protein
MTAQGCLLCTEPQFMAVALGIDEPASCRVGQSCCNVVMGGAFWSTWIHINGARPVLDRLGTDLVN